MPNNVGAIAVTRDRENFIQFVAIHDFTYWPVTPPTAWRHSSRVAIGTAYHKLCNGHRATVPNHFHNEI